METSLAKTFNTSTRKESIDLLVQVAKGIPRRMILNKQASPLIITTNGDERGIGKSLVWDVFKWIMLGRGASMIKDFQPTYQKRHPNIRFPELWQNNYKGAQQEETIQMLLLNANASSISDREHLVEHLNKLATGNILNNKREYGDVLLINGMDELYDLVDKKEMKQPIPNINIHFRMGNKTKKSNIARCQMPREINIIARGELTQQPAMQKLLAQ